MPKLILTAVLFLSYTPLTLAQSAGEYNKVEVFAGYSHNRVNTGISTGFNGFNVAATGNISKYVGLKFDFSGHFIRQDDTFFECVDFFPGGGFCINLKTRSALYNFLGGVQLKNNSKKARFKPFAHALVGVAHTKFDVDESSCDLPVTELCRDAMRISGNSDTGLAGAFGGGLDIRAGDRVDVRVVQVDYNPTRLFDSTQHNFRIVIR